MNRLITVFTVLFTLMLSVKSFASASLNPVYQQRLAAGEFTIKIDPQSELFNPMLTTHEIVVDYAHELVHVTFNQRTFCQENSMCLAVVPESIHVSFNLIEMTTNECGVVTYSAALETENGLNLMEISNHQNNQCASTDTYANETAISVVILSEASAEKLARLQ